MKKNLPVENPNGVLGRKDVMGMAVGQIIGSGIWPTLAWPSATRARAWSSPSSWPLCSTTCYNIPIILFGGTVPLKGGFYSQAGHLLGKKFSGAFAIVWICSNVVIAMYPLAFADYFLSLVPGINRKLIAMVVLTVVFLLNLFGVKGRRPGAEPDGGVPGRGAGPLRGLRPGPGGRARLLHQRRLRSQRRDGLPHRRHPAHHGHRRGLQHD